MKKSTWINHSIFSFITFFQVIAFIKPLIVMKINLHQSNAGIGSKLKTHKFILIIAQIIDIKIIHSHIVFVIRSTIQIGQLIDFIASVLSVFVFGKIIFLDNNQSASKVKIHW